MSSLTAALTILWLATPTEPRIELVTVGTGPRLFHRFGHAALCVVYDRAPYRTRCFNYGTTDFESPPQKIGWKFVRGTARFWVSTQGYGPMMAKYREFDRSIWIQRLDLTQRQVDHLLRLLAHDIKKENRSYTYHHFDDNCATRLRDHLDRVTGGALKRGSQKILKLTFRELGRRGIADQTALIVLSHFVLGRRLDEPITEWEAMFHPKYLRAQVARRLGAPAVQVYRRRGKPLREQGGRGYGWILLIALLIALPVAATRFWGRFERVAVGLSAGILTLIALCLWFIAVVTTVAEMRWNEALLVFWPTDLLLVLLGRRRQLYARIRVGWLVLLCLLWGVGVLRQPLCVLGLLPGLTCLALCWRWRVGGATDPGDSEADPRAAVSPDSLDPPGR